MRLDRLARLLLIGALLAAQSNGLAHELWHLRSGGPQSVAGAAEAGKAAQGNPLCAQHQALDAVLGALHSAAPLPLCIESAHASGFAAFLPAADQAPLSPSSRGPPGLV